MLRVKWAHPCYAELLAGGDFRGKVSVWAVKDSGDKPDEVLSYYSHHSAINSLDFANYKLGLILLVGSSDSTFSLHKCDKNKIWTSQKKLSAHEKGVLAVDFSPLICPYADPSEPIKLRFATGAADSLIKVWEVTEGLNFEKITSETLTGHKNWVRDISWQLKVGTDSETMASCGEDGMILLWRNAGKGWEKTILATFDVPIWTVAFNSNVTLLSAATGHNSVCIYKEKNEEWEQVNQLEAEMKAADS